MKYLSLAVFILLSLFNLAANASDSNLTTLVFGGSIQPREARADEYDKAAHVSAHIDVQFKIDEPAVVRAGQIQVNGFLINSGVSRITVFLRGQLSTLRLEPKESDQVKIRTDLPAKARDSAPLYVLVMPPKSRVQFTGATDLGALKYSGAPELKLKWSFQYWTSPLPTGEITIKLPTLDEAKLPPLKIEIEKFNSANGATEGTIAKITASVRNVSNEPQIYCRNANPNVDWDLLSATGTKLPNLGAKKLMARALSPLNESDCSVLAPGTRIDIDTAALIASKASYEFQSQKLTVSSLSKGSYEIHVSTLSGAAAPNADDAKFLKAYSEKNHAGVPTEKVETTQPLTIP
jgi:hypothetical protein